MAGICGTDISWSKALVHCTPFIGVPMSVDKMLRAQRAIHDAPETFRNRNVAPLSEIRAEEIKHYHEITIYCTTAIVSCLLSSAVAIAALVAKTSLAVLVGKIFIGAYAIGPLMAVCFMGRELWRNVQALNRIENMPVRAAH